MFYIHTDQFILTSHDCPDHIEEEIMQLVSKMIIGKMDNSGKNVLHFMPQLSMFTDPYNFPLKRQNGKSLSSHLTVQKTIRMLVFFSF